MPSNTSLSLNRKLQNPQFESWKLGSDFVKSRTCLQLPGQVYQGAGDAVDFLHTKASVLRNHLIESQGRLFVATINNNQTLVLNEVVASASGGVQVLRLAEVPAAAHDPLLGTAVEATLDCSLAVLPAPAAAAVPQAAGGSQAAAAAGAAGFHNTAAAAGMMLVSTGKGDLLLLQRAEDGSMAASLPVFPLRPRPPAVGVRPFAIEAGWLAPTGHIRAVLSALRSLDGGSSSSNGARAPAGQLRGVCELWLVALQASPAAGSSEEQQQQQAGPVLQVVSSQLLMLSKGPPAAAVAAAAAAGAAEGGSGEALLLVGEPALEEDELPAGYAAGAALAKSEAAPRAPLAFTAAQGQPAGSTANGTAGTAGAAAGSAAAAAAAAAAGLNDDMDIDPRTLQQAAARLAQFSSEEALGELPQQQWTDVFKESGPGDSLSSAELAVDVMLFTAAAPAAGGEEAGQASAAAVAVAGPAAASSSPEPQPLALASCVSCAPHRLLAVQASAPGSSGLAQPGLLLGLSDDVDCALVSAQLSSPGQVAAAGDSSAAAGSSSSSSSSAGGWGVALCHQAYLPALAYVVSGKTQRRHLLLGDSCSPVCGVLVEGQKYAYLYGQPSAQQQHGQQQILDMELPAGSRVLGARLLQGRGGGAAAAAHGGAASKGASTTARLLLLTSSQLMCYTLQGP